MTSIKLDIFSPSESRNLKSLLKNPDEDFQEIVSLLERKIYESNKQLRDIDEKYRYFIENSLEGVWVVDENANTVFVNSSMAKILGYTIEEMVDQSVFVFMDENSIKLTKFHLEKRKKGISEERDAVMVHKNGHNVNLRIRATPIFNKDGNYEGTYAFLTDITERKLAEEKLMTTERRLRSLIEQTTDAVFCYEFNPPIPIELPIEEQVKLMYNCNLVDCNLVCAQSYGYNRGEDVIGHKLTDLFGTTPSSLDKLFRNMIEGGYRIVDGVGIEKLPNGEERFFLNNGHGVIENGKLLRIWGTFRDITDRVKAEQALKESENLFRTIAETSIDSVYQLDLNGDILFMNLAGAKMYGYESKEMIGMNFKSLMMDDRLPEGYEIVEKILSGQPVRGETYVRHKKGYEFPIQFSMVPLKKDQKVVGFTGISRDITERKKTEQILKESEEKYRVLTEQSLMGIFILQKGRFKYINQAVSEINGYSVEEMLNWTEIDIAKTIYSEDLENIMNNLKRSHKGDLDEASSSTFRIITKSGKLKWLEEYNKKIIYQGEPASLVTLIDITSKIDSEQKLRESEEKFRTITDQSFMGIFILQDGKFKYANHTLSKIIGYPLERILKWTQNNIFRKIHPEDLSNIAESYRKNLQGHPIEMRASQFRFKHKNGSYIWLETFSKRIEYENKPATLTSIVDITEKKTSEQKIKESEENFRTVAEDSHLAITILQDDLVVYTNQKMADMFGYEREEMLKWTPKEYAKTVAEDSLEFVMEQARKKQIGDPDVITQYPIHCVKSSGEKFWVDNISTTIVYNGRPADLVTIIDTTDMREAEQKLKESEEKFRNIAEQSIMGIIILQDGLFKYFNDRISEMNGYSAEEMKDWAPNEWVKAIYPEDREFVMEQARKKQAGDPDVIHQYRYRTLRKNGEIRWMEIFSRTITYEGRPADLAMTIDIDDKIKAEQRLKESEEKFRNISDQSLIGIGIVQDRIVKYVNKKFADIFGYTPEEMYNWSPEEFMKTVHPDDKKFVFDQVKKKLSGSEDYLENYQFRGIKKSGEIIWIENYTKSILYEGKVADFVAFIDISERKIAQQELIKLNKLKSELLRRTSHELKTPLVSIKGFTELLLEVHRDKLDALIISTLNEIKQGCLRLETLIGDILKTAELESGTIQLYKLEEDLSFLVRLCVNEIKGFSTLRNHTITVELQDKLMTQFEKEQIHQVISNLLNNAVKYTPPNGLIEIKSDIRDDFIILSIKDNGIGFTEEEKSRIFKQFGKIERYGQGLDIIAEGSGFGLYISKKIIELHGGEIWVESKGRNKGSTFYFSLPLN